MEDNVNQNQAVPDQNTTPPTQPTAPIGIKPRIMNKFPKSEKIEMLKKIAFFVTIIVAGLGSGRILSTTVTGKTSSTRGVAVQSADEAGIENEIYSDEAEGMLEEGGIEGEGNFHLVRGDGPHQYVYLYSTVIDLSKFQGKNVKVWGQTLAATHAPWLMDVGKIKVVN